MLLHLARSETRRWTGRRLYSFRAALDCNADERRIILAHGLDRERVYTAPFAFDLQARAEAAHERAYKLSVWKSSNLPSIYWHSGKTLALAIRSRLAFHVTVGDLLRGAILQSTDLAEIREAEAAINEAFVRLDASIDQARRFEAGDEILVTPIEDDPPAHPATWPRHWRN
jgi:hypothetical protein